MEAPPPDGETAAATTPRARPGRDAPPPRGAADRVAAVHRQARRSLGTAAGFAVAAPAAAVLPHDTGSWLPLHLFLVGALLSAISGATQLLAVTWSASPAPARPLAAAQRWSLAGGTVAVAAGREAGNRAVTTAGGAAVALGLVLLAASLVVIRRGAVTDRFAPAIDAYLTALAGGAAGIGMGIALAAGATGGRWAELRSAHLTVNVYGLVGIVVIGTLPYFTATQARTRMSPRATPRHVRLVTAGAAAATATAAAGHLVDRPGLAASGLAAYVVALGATVALLPRLGRRQWGWAGPRLVQLVAGIAWWAATTAALAVATAGRHSDQGPILRALAIGGFGQILVASLAYFGPVLRGGGHRRLGAGFALTGSWSSVAAANVAAAGALADVGPLAAAGLAAWVVEGALRAARLVASPEPGPPPTARS